MSLHGNRYERAQEDSSGASYDLELPISAISMNASSNSEFGAGTVKIDNLMTGALKNWVFWRL